MEWSLFMFFFSLHLAQLKKNIAESQLNLKKIEENKTRNNFSTKAPLAVFIFIPIQISQSLFFRPLFEFHLFTFLTRSEHFFLSVLP